VVAARCGRCELTVGQEETQGGCTFARIHPVNANPRRCLSAILLLGSLLAATVRGQYVEDSIDVGAGWVGSLAYNSRADVVYGGCQTAGILFAISCDSNNVVSSLSLSWPRNLAYDSIDNKGYVAFAGAEEDSLAVIDGFTHQVVKKIQMPGATMPVWDPVSDRVYVSCQSTNKVAVVDCASDSLLKYMSVGACPMKMYINTLRRKLYVLNYDNGTVSIVNMTTNQVIKNLVVGGTPNAGYYCRSADKFYSAGAYGYCTVIDGAADSIVARISLPGTNADIRGATGNENAGLVHLATDLAYVAIVRTQDDSLLATSAIGGELWGITCYDKSGLTYCASGRNDAVYVISTDGEQVLATLPVGDYPYVFAVVPQHDRLYVGHIGGRHVYVLRDTSAGVTDLQTSRFGNRGPAATPNPFSHGVSIEWGSPRKGGGIMQVYALDGRAVRQVRISSGQSSWVWNGRDDEGRAMAPGVYVVESHAGRQKVVKLKCADWR
jgi:YVTN family beta-propeller protein